MNELDELMSLDPLALAKDPEAIDKIIAYQRRHRANLAAGIKTKKEEGPKRALDLDALGLAKPKGPTMTRRA